MNRIILFTAACLATLPAWSQASPPCLVLGASTARVATPEGEKSPPFMAAECSALRLVAGQAQASWVARDGQPRLVPITPQGVAQVPAPGSEERSVKVVWSELTSKRERAQPGYMRDFGPEKPPRVYVPPGGLRVVETMDAPGMLSAYRLDTGAEEPVFRADVVSGAPAVLGRDVLKPDQVYRVQLVRGDLREEWKWRAAPAADQAAIDESIAQIDKALEAPQQRLLMQAMLYEQLRLRVNMALAIERLRAGTGP